jgi:hypothetical protein
MYIGEYVRVSPAEAALALTACFLQQARLPCIKNNDSGKRPENSIPLQRNPKPGVHHLDADDFACFGVNQIFYLLNPQLP